MRGSIGTSLGVASIVTILISGCSGSGSPDSTQPETTTVTSSTSETPTGGGATSTTGTSATAGSTTSTTIPLDQVSISLVELDAGFDNPVLLVAAPDGGTDLIVEQPGTMVRADADHSVVVDISGDVRFEGEQGLLGLAIHPNFDENNLVYVNYTNNSGDTVIEQLALVDGGIDLASRTTILTIDQPAGNHNGGMIAFGPDGYLWIAMGDGGASNDRFGNGQNPDSLLGSMLRIEVGAPGVVPFGIPPDNPFADGVGGRPEVWAIGLRNPWRFDFDGETVWIADVGQERLEEVNAVPTSEPGLNYGWSIMEGSACFRANECATDGLVVPIAEYAHPDGCSITGGVVYRGDAVPSLRGQYFFSDFCSGILRSVSIDGVGRDWTDMIGPIGGATGFGVGGDGEMYVVTKQGSLFRLEGAGNG